MINPTKLLKLKDLWAKFSGEHPKFVSFLNAVNKKGITEGTTIEAKVTYPDGKDYTTRIRVTEQDLELFEQLKELNS